MVDYNISDLNQVVDFNSFTPKFPTLESNIGFFGDLYNLIANYFGTQFSWLNIFQQNILFFVLSVLSFGLFFLLLGFLPRTIRVIVSFVLAWFIAMPILFGIATWLGIMRVF